MKGAFSDLSDLSVGVSLDVHAHHLSYVNKLREYWLKSKHAVVIDGHINQVPLVPEEDETFLNYVIRKLKLNAFYLCYFIMSLAVIWLGFLKDRNAVMFRLNAAATVIYASCSILKMWIEFNKNVNYWVLEELLVSAIVIQGFELLFYLLSLEIIPFQSIVQYAHHLPIGPTLSASVSFLCEDSRAKNVMCTAVSMATLQYPWPHSSRRKKSGRINRLSDMSKLLYRERDSKNGSSIQAGAPDMIVNL